MLLLLPVVAAPLLVAPTYAVAAPDDGQPSARQDPPTSAIAPPPARPGADPRRPSADRRRRWMDRLPTTVPTEDEWSQISAFLDTHSPARWPLLKRVLDLPTGSDFLRRVIFSHWLDLKKLQTEDPEEYAFRVGQLKLEDEIFASEGRLVAAEASGKGDVAALRAQFEQKVRTHVERELRAKEAKISRLESQLQQQRAALDRDRQNMSQTVDDRISFARRASDWFRRWTSGEGVPPNPPRPGADGDAEGRQRRDED